MRRSWQRYAWNAMDAFVWVATIFVVAWAISQPKLVRPGVTVPVVGDVEQAPAVDVAPDPTPAADGKNERARVGKAISRGPLVAKAQYSVYGPEGVLEIPWSVNWDALVAERPVCAAQLLDIQSSHGQPCDMQHYSCAEAMFSAAWKFCPKEWRR